jgi:outer membrane protein assembly factor BamB
MKPKRKSVILHFLVLLAVLATLCFWPVVADSLQGVAGKLIEQKLQQDNLAKTVGTNTSKKVSGKSNAPISITTGKITLKMISPEVVSGYSCPRKFVLSGEGFRDNLQVFVSWQDGQKVLDPKQIEFQDSRNVKITINIGINPDRWVIKVRNGTVGSYSNSVIFDVRAPVYGDLGAVIGEFKGIKARSNGACTAQSHDIGENKCGTNWQCEAVYQCVEYVKRYYREHFPSIQEIQDSWVNAQTFWDKSEHQGLMRVRNSTSGLSPCQLPRPGDIIFFNTGLVDGHVAIVTNSSGKGIEVIQQNMYRYSAKATITVHNPDSKSCKIGPEMEPMKLSSLSEADQKSKHFPVLGWLSPKIDAGITPTNMRIPLSDAEWPMYGHDPARTAWNSTNSIIYPPFRMIWNKVINNYYADGLSVAERMIYVSGESKGAKKENKVYALTTSGEMKWSYTLDNGGTGAMGATPAYYKNKVYFGGQHDDRLYALQNTTGEKAWTIAGIKGMYESPPNVLDGIVYAFGEKNKLIAVDTETGKKLWFKDADGWAGRTAIWGNIIVAYSWNTHPSAFNAITGKSLWERNDISTYFSDIIAYDNRAYLGGRGMISALNLFNGQTIWTTLVPSNLEFTDVDDYSIAFADGILYIAGGVRETDKSPKPQNIIFAVDAKTGSIIWQSKIDSSWGNLAVANGVVYVRHRQRRLDASEELVAMNAKTGSVLWRWQPSGEGKNHLAGFTVANNRLYLAYSNLESATTLILCFDK